MRSDERAQGPQGDASRCHEVPLPLSVEMVRGTPAASSSAAQHECRANQADTIGSDSTSQGQNLLNSRLHGARTLAGALCPTAVRVLEAKHLRRRTSNHETIKVSPTHLFQGSVHEADSVVTLEPCESRSPPNIVKRSSPNGFHSRPVAHVDDAG